MVSLQLLQKSRTFVHFYLEHGPHSHYDKLRMCMNTKL